MVVRQGVKLVAIGIVIGVALSLAATRVLGSFLYALSATDLLSFLYVALLLLGVAWRRATSRRAGQRELIR